MKKLAFLMLAALPFVGGCYAYAPCPAYVRGYGPRYHHPYRVYVAPPPARVYW